MPSGTNIYLVGPNKLMNQAVVHVLNSRGFNAVSGEYEEFFRNERKLTVDLEIVVWEEHYLESRGSSVFDSWNFVEKNFRSVFILSKKTFSFLGLGLTHGVDGFVHTNGGVKELETGLLNVLNDSIYISPHFSGVHILNGKKKYNAKKNGTQLTSQEEKILEFVWRKKTSKEIAKILSISPKTVQNHRYNICNKLGISGRGRNKLYEFASTYFETLM